MATVARNLVKVCDEVAVRYGIPIVNKRIAVSPDCGRRMLMRAGSDGRGRQGDGPRGKGSRGGFHRRVQRPCRKRFHQGGPRPHRGHPGGACGNRACLLLGKCGVHPCRHQHGCGLPHGKNDKEGRRADQGARRNRVRKVVRIRKHSRRRSFYGRRLSRCGRAGLGHKRRRERSRRRQESLRPRARGKSPA